MAQVKKHQRQDGLRRARRLALITGVASLSLLGVGFVLQPALPDGKLRNYTMSSVASPPAVLLQSPGMHEPPLLPQNSGMREPPRLPQSSGVYEQPRRVQ